MLQVPTQREGAAAWTQARKPLRGGPGPRPYPQPSAARPGPGGLVRGPVEIIIVAVIMCGHVPHAGQLVSAAPRPSVHILSNAPCSSLQVRLRDAQGSAKATQLGPEARVCAHRSPPVPPPPPRGAEPPAWAKPMARGEDKVPPRCRFKKKMPPKTPVTGRFPAHCHPEREGPQPARTPLQLLRGRRPGSQAVYFSAINRKAVKRPLLVDRCGILSPLPFPPPTSGHVARRNECFP